MAKDLTEDRIHSCLEGAVFGNETVRILVEGSGSKASAAKGHQETAPLVVVGSSRLPPQWPSIVSKWSLSVEKKDENAT
ncbi:hypothetical protein FOMG_19160 [Fusarium oxysporum f. sp. melonis 26406]|uniref:Uncharacterized protein n=1 Tax=Fusarium oxysporum f. sp. melonis 26406 TaxID=1089452 RepID=W9YX26_FUSOX|nr:hypothetical protein FOMG_19160 [Fusarium oxysporum f. sp. melonis 26406]